MKLNDLLDEFPWERTYESLCSEPDDPTKLPLEWARELIDSYRDSQVAVLSRAMYGPRLTPEWRDRDRRRGLDASPSKLSEPRLPRFELSDPVRAARAFLRVAAQAGAGLEQFQSEHLTELDSTDTALGRLLQILATAGDPRVDPEVPLGLLSALLPAAVPFLSGREAFGPVLTPMFVLAVSPWVEPSQRDAAQLTWKLVEEVGTTDRHEELTRWIAGVVEAGSASIEVSTRLNFVRPPSEEVARSGLGPLYYEQAVAQGRRGIHARDIVVAGDREVNRTLIERIQSLHDIQAADFIYEPQPGVVRIRTWSELPVPEQLLMGAADESGSQVIEFLDETLM
jgi:hypothetical protein